MERPRIKLSKKKRIEVLEAKVEFLNDVMSYLIRKNSDLRELVADLILLPSVDCFDCYGCRYDEHDDCRNGCVLLERARELGIEVDDERRN